jgi:hypothetical protein
VIALVSGASATLRVYADTGAFGRLVVPGSGNRVDIDPPLPWAADNGAFSGFQPRPFVRMLDRVQPFASTCLFVACPDVVGDAAGTARMFDTWAPAIERRGLPLALVVQDGLEDPALAAWLTRTWHRLAAIFVGGSTEWKVGPHASALIREARRRELWVHVGRVNTLQRYRLCQSLGVDSIDGTSLSRWSKVYMPRYVQLVHGRPTLLTEV